MQRQSYRQVEGYLATVLELRGIHNHNVQAESRLMNCKDWGKRAMAYFKVAYYPVFV